jgi:peptidylprolyl isomerase
VRIRPIIALSAVALAAVALVGCSSQAAPKTSPTSTSAAPDLCTAKVASGAASDAVKVTGEVGKEAKISFTKPLTVDKLQSTVVTEGKGDKLKAGDLVQFALTEYNAKTGDKNGAIGQTASSLLPQQVSADSVLGKVLGCAGVGTRVVATMPGDESTPASIDVVDVLKIVPTAAWGAAQAPVAGMPTVELAKNGTPSITIPKGAAEPKDLKIAVLKKGDGAKVAEGDQVLTQYLGVTWADGKKFDSSWERGAPAPFNTQGVYQGFGKAMVGQTVGSQVLVVMPPSMGDTSGSLKGKTLVFVIDILGAQHAGTQ